MRLALLSFALVAAALVLGMQPVPGAAPAHAPVAAPTAESGITPPVETNPCPSAAKVPHELQLPAVLPPGDPIAFEKQLLDYLHDFKYRHLGWCFDKYVRDTGPYVHGQYYGTHPAVRIYYSPEMMTWLRNGRRGVPADGAVIIKEQFNPAPAARYEGLDDAHLQPHDWTVMIRRSGASHDGWFWAEVYTKTAENKPMTFGGTQYPNAGSGCTACAATVPRTTPRRSPRSTTSRASRASR